MKRKTTVAIRFIGYPIPTTPANLQMVGGEMIGTYLGHEDTATDIAARVAILKNAVDAAKSKLPPPAAHEMVINLFVAPEFFFHGPLGPYFGSRRRDDPARLIQKALKRALPASEYPDWIFVCGSALTAKADNLGQVLQRAKVRNTFVRLLAGQILSASPSESSLLYAQLSSYITCCHTNPCLQVRDRAFVLSHLGLEAPDGKFSGRQAITEKYFVSDEDLVLCEPGGREVITEQMIAYPFIDLSGGDLKKDLDDEFAVFNVEAGGLEAAIGIEICLDHYDERLRQNQENRPESLRLQVIPSCGMSIFPSAVAVGAGGFVFNCDGQAGLDQTQGEGQAGILGGVPCLYANYVDPKNKSLYGGHTQLAQVETPAEGTRNATFRCTLDRTDIAVVPVPHREKDNLEQYFAGGSAEVHIYGLNRPYPLFSDAGRPDEKQKIKKSKERESPPAG